MSTNAHPWRSIHKAGLVGVVLLVAFIGFSTALRAPTIHAAAATHSEQLATLPGFTAGTMKDTGKKPNVPAGAPAATSDMWNQSTCIQPPSQTTPNLRHDQLSDAKLKSYGMLPRSSISNPTLWAQVVDNDTHRLCGVYQTADKHPAATTSAATMSKATNPIPLNEHGPYVSNQWAGYSQAANSQQGNEWADSQGTWYVQSIINNNFYVGEVADWIGEGGGVLKGGNLVQTGESMKQFWVGGVAFDQYWAWIANCAINACAGVTIGNFPVNPGNEMYAEVNQNFVYIEDFATGDQYSDNYGPSADIQEAECIREEIAGSEEVIQTTQVEFFSCQAQANDGKGTWIAMGCNTCDAYEEYIIANQYYDYVPQSPPVAAYGNFAIYYEDSF